MPWRSVYAPRRLIRGRGWRSTPTEKRDPRAVAFMPDTPGVAQLLQNPHVHCAHSFAAADCRIDWQAAFASALSFTVGAILPLFAVLLPPPAWRLPATFVAVAIALVITGWLSAYLGGSPKPRAISRVLLGGLLALGVTWAIGAMIGSTL